jgi:thioredoxin-related protein
MIAFSVSVFSFAQTDSESKAPYLRFPTVPAFELLTADSIHYTKKNIPNDRAVLIILFNPNCDHCQHETEEILKNIDKFKKIQIVMATGANFADLKNFHRDYNLGNYPGITAGIELKYILASFFDIRTLPYLAMYDKKGKLLGVHEGNLEIEDILKFYK